MSYEILQNENVICWDVDETLILHKKWYPKIPKKFKLGPNQCWIHDIRIGQYLLVTVHVPHIVLLKQSYYRGRFNIVWSAAGTSWADMVIKQLGLLSYVNVIMTKPVAYFDDKDANTFMNRVYVPIESTEDNSNKLNRFSRTKNDKK